MFWCNIHAVRGRAKRFATEEAVAKHKRRGGGGGEEEEMRRGEKRRRRGEEEGRRGEEIELKESVSSFINLLCILFFLGCPELK